MRRCRLPGIGAAAALALALAFAGCARPAAVRTGDRPAGAPAESAPAPAPREPVAAEPSPGEAAAAQGAAAGEATREESAREAEDPGAGTSVPPEATPAPAEEEIREETIRGEEIGEQGPPPPREESGAAPGPPRVGEELARRPPAGAERSDVPARGAEGPGRAPPPRMQAVVALLPEHLAFPKDGPPWARGKEELTYKVEFLGLTMGYAKFTFRGKVLLEGREAYHLTVRAWTTDLLAVLYPINDTIEYYLDVDTLVPLRMEFTKSRKEDDVAFYDQATGSIVYRFKSTGEIRKKVEAVPGVYDPVSLAYYLRTRDFTGGGETRPMYAGKKLYELSALPLGYERIRTDRGEFDTILIQPVLRRDGNIENKGDMRLWMTRDERHLPVRVYAKFKKIRTWTLVGELQPAPQEG